MRGLVTALAAAASLAIVAPADAASWKDFPAVSNGSFAVPDGGRVQRLTIEIPASAAEVWAALSTADGWKTWAVPVASVDLRVGGLIQTSYDPKKAKTPDIANQIVAFVPEKLLVIRNAKAPSDFVDPLVFATITTAVEIEAKGPKATQVSFTSVGYGPGAAYDRLYERFEWGNAYSLDQLRLRFVRGPIDWTKASEGQAAAEATKTVDGSKGG